MSQGFTLKDKRCLINLRGRKAEVKMKRFIEGFPQEFQKMAALIFTELELRNFNVPGFDYYFFLNILDATISVSHVRFNDFYIGSWSQVNIKGKKISIHSDGSGSMDVFLGDPEKDKKDYKEFQDSTLIHRKMNNKKKIHLHYNYRHGVFTVDNDLSRQYDAEGSEPTRYTIEDILGEALIEMNQVLKHIKEQPVPEYTDPFVEPDHVELTNPLFKDMKLYGFKEEDRAQNYSPEDSIGLTPCQRLVTLGSQKPDKHPHNNVMNDGFVYLELNNKVPMPEHTRLYNYSLQGGWGRAVESYEVNPKNFNDFYVIDGSLFEKQKAAWFANYEKENPDYAESKVYEVRSPSLTDALVAEYKKVEVNTMVHINDYKGGYEKPIVITNRTIWPDEIKMIGSKTAKELLEA